MLSLDTGRLEFMRYWLKPMTPMLLFISPERTCWSEADGRPRIVAAKPAVAF